MKKLIVTADDYGMSKGVNAAIDAGIDAGLITSTNVMTNMEFYRAAAELRKKNVSVGIHWTVSAGRPVCAPEEIPSLTTADGKFYSYPEFRSRYRKKLISDADIRKELKAQYDRFVEVCGQPDYWNTHQNTHVDFGVFKLFVDTAAELEIYKMRSHQRVYIPASDGKGSMSLKWKLFEPVKRALLNSWMRYARKKGMQAPSGVVLALKKTDGQDPQYCFANLEMDEQKVAEYVIHPSTVLDSEFFGSIGTARLREYEQFTSREQANVLSENGFELTDFKDVI